MATGSAHLANGGSCNDVRLISKDPGLTWAHPDNAMLAAQCVRRSSRRNDVCGCRLASALAGTGGSGSAAPGAIEGASLALEMLADGGAGSASGAPTVSSGDIPASVQASIDGLVVFMNRLIDTDTNDTSEPILLGDASLPADDTI